MTYVAYEEKSAAQRAADRAADEQWMKDHAPVYEPQDVATTGRYYRPAVEFSAVGSAH